MANVRGGKKNHKDDLTIFWWDQVSVKGELYYCKF